LTKCQLSRTMSTGNRASRSPQCQLSAGVFCFRPGERHSPYRRLNEPDSMTIRNKLFRINTYKIVMEKMTLTLAESTLTLNPGGRGAWPPRYGRGAHTRTFLQCWPQQIAPSFTAVRQIRSIETLHWTCLPFALTIPAKSRFELSDSSESGDLNTVGSYVID